MQKVPNICIESRGLYVFSTSRLLEQIDFQDSTTLLLEGMPNGFNPRSYIYICIDS